MSRSASMKTRPSSFSSVSQFGSHEWLIQRAALRLRLSGWVRNRSDGTVEALIDGDVAAVEELSRLCRRGPRLAEVTSITEELAEPPEQSGFYRVASV